jgi:hypothetical protein
MTPNGKRSVSSIKHGARPGRDRECVQWHRPPQAAHDVAIHISADDFVARRENQTDVPEESLRRETSAFPDPRFLERGHT